MAAEGAGNTYGQYRVPVLPIKKTAAPSSRALEREHQQYTAPAIAARPVSAPAPARAPTSATGRGGVTTGTGSRTGGGGGGGGGGGTGGGGGGGAATGRTDPLSMEQMAANYGWAYSFLNSNAELRGLFETAVRETWDGPLFAAKVRDTNWFKTTNEAARQWQILAATDPSTAQQRRNSRSAELRQMRDELGGQVDDGWINNITEISLMSGWNDSQFRQNLATTFVYTPGGTYRGAAGKMIDAVRQASYDYLVPVSDDTTQAWARNAIAGSGTEADFVEYAKQTATGLFPGLAKQIAGGMTVQQLADPYRELAAKNLEIAPDSVDFFDAKYRRALDNTDASGNRGMMSLADWDRTMKTDTQYGFDFTNNARETASQFATKIAEKFGAFG